MYMDRNTMKKLSVIISVLIIMQLIVMNVFEYGPVALAILRVQLCAGLIGDGILIRKVWKSKT